MLAICLFLAMEDTEKVFDGLKKSVWSFQDQTDSIKKSGKVSVSEVKSPKRSSPSARRGDEVPLWVDRMELKTEALMQPGNNVLVHEEIELLFQKAFTPLKKLDHRVLWHQFLVPDFPVTMALKLDKVMAAECLLIVQSGLQINPYRH